MKTECIVSGASSQVGDVLLSLLPAVFSRVTAWSRQTRPEVRGVTWECADLNEVYKIDETVTHFIHLAPLALLASVLEHAHPMRVIAISTCSVRHKANSASLAERRLAQQFLEAEQQVVAAAQRKGHQLTLLRPTMLYGLGRDGTVGMLQQLALRFGFLLVPGKALGLRQPVHVMDVAQAVMGCIAHEATISKCYEIGGLAPLTLRQLSEKIFSDNGKKPRVYSVPLWVLKPFIHMVRALKIRPDWDVGLLSRASQNQAVDNRPAMQDFAYQPRHFSGKRIEQKTIRLSS